MKGVTFHYYGVPNYRALTAENSLELVDVQDYHGSQATSLKLMST
jgi:hypothetical protein